MSNKLRIVYLLPSGEISGGSYVACEHARGLRRRGHEVSLAIARGVPGPISWFPGLDLPVIRAGEIGPDTDVVVATWWETVYLAARAPARLRCYLVQAIEPLFYGKEKRAEHFFSSFTYRLGYPCITVAGGLAQRLGEMTGRETCLVANRLNPDFFGPSEPMSPDELAAASCAAFLSFGGRSARRTLGQVFWDRGNGFSEAESAVFRMGPAGGEWRIALPEIRHLKRLRIDTGNLPGNTVEIFSPRLAGSGGAENLADACLWEANADVSRFSRAGGGLRVETAGGDPFIVFSVPEGMRERLDSAPGVRRFRILVEGPLDIEFKGVRRSLDLARRAGAEVWLVDGKAAKVVGSVFGAAHPDRVFNRVPIDRMRRIYASCDLLLKLSRVESFAYPPLEMMACGGIPVVGDVEGVHEYLVDGCNGVIVPPGDDEATLRALERLMGDERLRARLRAGCAETAARLTGWGPSIDALERFLVGRVAAGGGIPREIPVQTEEIVECYLSLMRRQSPPPPAPAIPPRPPAEFRAHAGADEGRR